MLNFPYSNHICNYNAIINDWKYTSTINKVHLQNNKINLKFTFVYIIHKKKLYVDKTRHAIDLETYNTITEMYITLRLKVDTDSTTSISLLFLKNLSRCSLIGCSIHTNKYFDGKIILKHFLKRNHRRSVMWHSHIQSKYCCLRVQSNNWTIYLT